MTDLDTARAAEAARLWGEREGAEHADCGGIAALAARLAREGWEPVDPLLMEAREIAASFAAGHAHQILAGDWDHVTTVRSPLAALKRGIELAKERG